MTDHLKTLREALEKLQGLCSEQSDFVEQITIWTPEALDALDALEQVMRDKSAYEALLPLVTYNKSTGDFYWNETEELPRWMWKKAAGSPESQGYINITYQGKRYLAHRLAWLITYGAMPLQQIDHINMDRADNRIANLRIATIAENNRNRKAQANSKSGYKGVSQHNVTKRWMARIHVNGKRIALGTFATPEEAHAAYIKGAKEYHHDYARSE